MLPAVYLAMGAVALAYDWPALAAIPWYLLPLVVICPVYPTLLAVALLTGRRGVLAGIATVPAAVFGLLALAFYPLYMLRNGFAWTDLGQIFWVLAYAVPALLLSPQVSPRGRRVGGLFSLACLLTLYETKSFGYLGLADITDATRLFLLVLGCLGAATLLFVLETGVFKQNALFHGRQ